MDFIANTFGSSNEFGNTPTDPFDGKGLDTRCNDSLWHPSGIEGQTVTVFNIPLQFLLGLLYANLGEWLFHKFILHGLGKNPRSIWAFHWHEHHTVCAENQMYDPSYQKITVSTWNARAKELMVFFGTLLIHIPLLWYLPAFCLGLYVSLMLYYVKHRKAHLDPDWARKNLNWHYEHHINPNAGNWCVTWPWFDHLLGTRFKPDQANNDKA